MDACPILLVHPALCESRGQGSVARGGASEKKNSRGGLIESMNGPKKRFVRAQEAQPSLRTIAGGRSAAGDGEQAGWLVDRDEISIFVEDTQAGFRLAHAT